MYAYEGKRGKDAIILLSSMTFNAEIIRHSMDFNDNYEFQFQIVGNVGLRDVPDVSAALRMAEKETQVGASPPSAKYAQRLLAAFAVTKDSVAGGKQSESIGSFATCLWRKAASLRMRFWVEAGFAALSGLLGTLTLYSGDWIEALTGFDPDDYNGSFEWAIVAALFLVCVLSSLAARADWGRLTAAELAGV